MDNGCWKTMVFYHNLNKELGYTSCCELSEYSAKVGIISKSINNHDYGVNPGRRQPDNEIHSDFIIGK